LIALIGEMDMETYVVYLLITVPC